MRPSAPLRPIALAAVVASLGWSIIPGCFWDDTKYRTVFEPIQVRQVIFPDSVPLGQADSLVVLATVGYTGCVPGEVSLQERGDTLVVSGTFMCRYQESSLTAAGDADVTTPPAAPIEIRVVLALPELEAGMYFVAAVLYPGEQLLDTLVVASQGPVTRHERLVGFGYVYPHAVATCASWPIGYESLGGDWRLRGRYLVENPPEPFSSRSVYINATIAGPASCDSSFAGVLHLRNLEPWR